MNDGDQSWVTHIISITLKYNHTAEFNIAVRNYDFPICSIYVKTEILYYRIRKQARTVRGNCLIYNLQRLTRE